MYLLLILFENIIEKKETLSIAVAPTYALYVLYYIDNKSLFVRAKARRRQRAGTNLLCPGRANQLNISPTL